MCVCDTHTLHADSAVEVLSAIDIGGLFIWQKRPIRMAKEAYGYLGPGVVIVRLAMRKETYSYGKRGLSVWQKRPTDTSGPA